MKKTVIINISGIIFNIDEDAYDQLQVYLSKLNKHFYRKEDKEIVDDIELRIAELFKMKITSEKQVITIDDVADIISILGNPEEFNEGEPTQNNEVKEEPSYRRTFAKRFYRDSDDRILGGVASGLGAYFGIDPLIMRIIFVLLFIFALSGGLIYILLWLVIPEAKTPSQRLEMKGEEINISNIEKSIKEEFNTVKKNLKNHKTSGLRSILEQSVSILLSIINFTIRFLLVIIGLFLIVFSLSILIGFVGSFLIDGWGINNISISDALNLAFEPSSSSLGIIGLFIVVVIPLISMILVGIRLIFKIKLRNRIVNITTFVFWLMGLFLLLYVGFSEGIKFQSNAKTTESVVLKDSLNKTFTIKINNENNRKTLHHGEFDHYSIFISEDNFRIYGKPSIIISKSENDSIKLIINRKSRGVNRKEATMFSQNIDYNWTFNDSTLLLDDYFLLPFNEKWRVQKLQIILEIPSNRKISLSKEIEDYIDVYYDSEDNDYLSLENTKIKVSNENIE